MKFDKSQLIIESKDYGFGKLEVSPPLSYDNMERLKDELSKRGLVPFASEICDKVEHVHFFGRLDSIADFCRSLKQSIFEEESYLFEEKENKVVTCGSIIRGYLGGKFCHIREI